MLEARKVGTGIAAVEQGVHIGHAGIVERLPVKDRPYLHLIVVSARIADHQVL